MTFQIVVLSVETEKFEAKNATMEILMMGMGVIPNVI